MADFQDINVDTDLLAMPLAVAILVIKYCEQLPASKEETVEALEIAKCLVDSSRQVSVSALATAVLGNEPSPCRDTQDRLCPDHRSPTPNNEHIV